MEVITIQPASERNCGSICSANQSWSEETLERFFVRADSSLNNQAQCIDKRRSIAYGP